MKKRKLTLIEKLFVYFIIILMFALFILIFSKFEFPYYYLIPLIFATWFLIEIPVIPETICYLLRPKVREKLEVENDNTEN
ncbi:MAG TPA: hypothetical protein PKY81_16785 [bacterium]|nr:hypothetical protein [bacterium]